MENVYNVRTEIERVNSANPKFTGFGFFENNTVLGQEATKPVVRN